MVKRSADSEDEEVLETLTGSATKVRARVMVRSMMMANPWLSCTAASLCKVEHRDPG